VKETVIEIRNLIAKYGEKEILHDVCADFHKSEIKVILGTSGCGKTTLLKHIIGLVKPAHGSVRIFGTLIGELDEPDTVAILKKIGIVYQNGALLGSLSVAQNVALPLKMHTKLSDKIIDEIVRDKLRSVRMSHAYDLFPDELSGGMRKRAAIARALVLDPPILFCDEPSAGLDPVTSSGIDELLVEMRDRLSITIVAVTHEIESIKTIADSIIYLEKGRVYFDGSLKDGLAISEGKVHDFFNRIDRNGIND
jgi:phospholipid/cholesterol/gamma-HCH transport system ATP-binding protein